MLDGEQDVLDVEASDAGASDSGGADLDVDLGDSSTTTADVDTSADNDQRDDVEQPQHTDTAEREREEPEVSEFRTMVSAKLRSIIKKTPELAQVFKKYPALQDTMEATFRREAALREVFPTVAEARFMRDKFPNGQADVQALLEDVGELESLDKNYDTPGADGTYPGHTDLIDSFFSRDQRAAVALMKRIPKEWARRDPDSYNEVMGKIVGATFAKNGIPDFLGELIEAAKDTGLEKDLKKLKSWVDGYLTERPKPSEEEERLNADRRKLDQDRETASKQSMQTFHNTFLESSKKIQRAAIMSYPSIRRLEKLNTLSKEKLNDIVEKIRNNTVKFLSSSPSFMRKLRPAHSSMNLQECEQIQKAAWSQPWLLNRMVRSVLAKEVPQIVQQNRDALRRRTGTQRQPERKDGEQKPKGNYKDASGRWRRPDGSPFTTAEVLSGKHLL